MRGRQKGRATNRVAASVDQGIPINRAGMKFQVFKKWSRAHGRLGTLLVNNGGLRWRPANGKYLRRKTWQQVAEFLST